MQDAVAGSKPSRFSATGTSTPERPLAMQATIIASEHHEGEHEGRAWC